MEQANADIQKILKNKNIVLAVIVFLYAISLGLSLFKNHTTQSDQYKNQIRERNQKTDTIILYNKSKDDLAKFKASFVKQLDGEGLLNQLADYASQNKVSIVNILPGEVENRDEYSMTNVHLSIKAETFKDLISFFYSMEKSPYVFKIKSWAIIAQKDSSYFNCDVDVALVQMR